MMLRTVLLLLVTTSVVWGDNFIIFLVEAPHLDLSSNRAFLKTLAKHPSNGSKNGDVGHAWIYLQGKCNGEFYALEGGQSGELGIVQAKFFQGVMNYCDYGYAFPTLEQCVCPRKEPNPIKYLWATLYDGFFQEGSGGHRPTYAAGMPLTDLQFATIVQLIETYDFSKYCLNGKQCCSFISHLAKEIGLHLDGHTVLEIQPTLTLQGETLTLWQDPQYRYFEFENPDLLEAQLREAVRNRQAFPALRWYRKHFRWKPESLFTRLHNLPNKLRRFLLFQ